MGYCDACGEEAVIEDEGTDGCSQKVCAECGVIQSTDHPFFTDDQREASRPSDWLFGDQTVSKTMKRMLTKNREQEAMKIGLRRILEHGSALGLSENLTEESRQLFSNAYQEHFLHKTENFKLVLAAACVYCVCRLNKYSVPISHMCDIAQCDPRLFGRVYKLLSQKRSLVLPPCGAGSSLARVLSNVHWNNTSSIVKKTQTVLLLFEKFWLLTGRNTEHIITAALFIVWQSEDFPTRRKISLKRFCEQNNFVLNNTTKQRSSEMLSVLITLCKKIPWIASDSVTRNNVTMYLDDILKYQKSLMFEQVRTSKACVEGDNSDLNVSNAESLETGILPPCLKKRRVDPVPVSEEAVVSVSHDLDQEELTEDDIEDSKLSEYIRGADELEMLHQVKLTAVKNGR